MTLVVVLRPRQCTIAGRAASVNPRPSHALALVRFRLRSRANLAQGWLAIGNE
jgi:hypothetical protein